MFKIQQNPHLRETNPQNIFLNVFIYTENDQYITQKTPTTQNFQRNVSTFSEISKIHIFNKNKTNTSALCADVDGIIHIVEGQTA